MSSFTTKVCCNKKGCDGKINVFGWCGRCGMKYP